MPLRVPTKSMLTLLLALAAMAPPSQATTLRITPLDLGNGITVAGRIEVDGTIGSLTAANVTGWSVTVTQSTDLAVYDSATAPVASLALVSVAPDGRMLVPTSPDGASDGGSLGFGLPPVNPPPEFGVRLADFGGPFAAGGEAFFQNGAAFGYLPLGQPDGVEYTAAQARGPGSSVFDVTPLDFGSGIVLSGTITTNGTVGALGADDLVDWSLVVRETRTEVFDDQNSTLLADLLSFDGTTLSVENPDGILGFQKGLPLRGNRLTLADFSNGNDEAAYVVGRLFYQSLSPLSFDASYAVAAVPEPTTLVLLAGGLLGLAARRKRSVEIRSALLVAAACSGLVHAAPARATTVEFFDPSQLAADVASGVTSDTIASEGYLFTYTRDKLFTGGVGMTEPIGRSVRVPWPDGVEAQAVTSGPNPGKARIVIERVDGSPFDLPAFTARLLANTAATGAAFEIMPSLNGEDAFQDPLYFDASGFYGSQFSYDTSPNLLGSTALLTGFESYTIGLFVDFALTSLTLEGAPVPEPSSAALLGIGVVALFAARSRR